MFFDNGEFAFYSVAYLFGLRAVLLFYAGVDKSADIRFRVFARFGVVVREHIMPVNEPEIALIANFHRVLERFEVVGEELRHFVVTL